MKQRSDVCIVGGGPAGLAAAIALRNRGFDVIVADGAEPPIDKACGEGLLPDSVAALRELGIFLAPSEGRILRGIRFLEGSNSVEASFPYHQGIGVQRAVLHRKMLECASELGITLLWKTPVTQLHADGVTAGDQRITARWIVGADGIRSRVRRWSGLDYPTRNEVRYATRRHYHVDPWSECMEIYWGQGAQAYVTPVGTSRVCVVVISRDPAARFSDLQTEFPLLAKNLARAKQVRAERGAVTISRRLSHVYRGNVALIGDASGSIDAITGEGLSLSFRQALALPEALEANELRLYEKSHRGLARRPALMGGLLLMLDRHPALRARVMGVLAAHPDVFQRLLLVHVGESSATQFVKTGALLGLRLIAA